MAGSVVVVLLFACVAGGCGGTRRAPLDAATVPQGVGWFCYAHEAPGTKSMGICYRERDACAARATEDGNTTCSPVDQAHCVDLNPGANAPDVQCVATAEDCEVVASGTAGTRPSECKAFP